MSSKFSRPRPPLPRHRCRHPTRAAQTRPLQPSLSWRRPSHPNQTTRSGRRHTSQPNPAGRASGPDKSPRHSGSSGQTHRTRTTPTNPEELTAKERGREARIGIVIGISISISISVKVMTIPGPGMVKIGAFEK